MVRQPCEDGAHFSKPSGLGVRTSLRVVVSVFLKVVKLSVQP